MNFVDVSTTILNEYWIRSLHNRNQEMLLKSTQIRTAIRNFRYNFFRPKTLTEPDVFQIETDSNRKYLNLKLIWNPKYKNINVLFLCNYKIKFTIVCSINLISILFFMKKKEFYKERKKLGYTFVTGIFL